MKVADVVNFFEELAPSAYQESYDNAGLIIGNAQNDVTSILLTLDVTPAVVDEAIAIGANLIVSHHPLIFAGLKKITGQSYVERAAMLAIKHDIAIFAAHTNLDSVEHGVNWAIAQRLGVDEVQILQPRKGELVKFVVFVPASHAAQVRDSIFAAGAGCIGRYDCCSYSVSGSGTFRAQQGAEPFVGQLGMLHTEPEVRIETVMPKHIMSRTIGAVMATHPYEEVAYDVYPILNPMGGVGLGMVGDLSEAIPYMDFLQMVKRKFGAQCVRYTKPTKEKVQRIAFCGGSGASLLSSAIAQRADVFLTADFKYHHFFDAEDRLMIVDIGHYESEQFTIDIFFDNLSKKFPKFVVQKSGVITNPVNYI